MVFVFEEANHMWQCIMRLPLVLDLAIRTSFFAMSKFMKTAHTNLFLSIDFSIFPTYKSSCIKDVVFAAPRKLSWQLFINIFSIRSYRTLWKTLCESKPKGLLFLLESWYFFLKMHQIRISAKLLEENCNYPDF